MTEKLRNGLREWWPAIALFTSVFLAPTTAWVLGTTVDHGRILASTDSRLSFVEKRLDTCLRAEDLSNLCTQIARLEANVSNLEKLSDRLEKRLDQRPSH